MANLKNGKSRVVTPSLPWNWVGPHFIKPINEHSHATGAAVGPPTGPPALAASILTLSSSALRAASIPSRTN
ncbi:hypothetical protein Tco_0935198 [Tanacetum coccineum]